jgi:hypothetical protein
MEVLLVKPGALVGSEALDQVGRDRTCAAAREGFRRAARLRPGVPRAPRP